jgi:L-2-hydroxyglutarate oxidase
VEKVDVLVVGGGIIGLATAYQLLKSHNYRVTVIEKAPTIARHQTGHNSGVLHSGIYYDPASVKAQLARRGKDAMIAFCRSEGIAHKICGKVIVATTNEELQGLARIEERARLNQVLVERLSVERLKEIEPYVTGISALSVPATGIVDFVAVCHKLVEGITSMGGHVRLNTELLGTTRYPKVTIVETNRESIEAKLVVAACGLQADRVALRLGFSPRVRIVPFRGEYYLLDERVQSKVTGLIYPVPDAKFPFLGVHFTRRISGQVDCGPNAVLSLSREIYERNEIHWEDLVDTLTYSGFQRFALRHLSYGINEAYRSWSKSAFTRELQKLIPSIRSMDLLAAPTGIRAQAVSSEGEILHDFLFEEAPRAIGILNAPSPAATASLEIGRIVTEKALRHLE